MSTKTVAQLAEEMFDVCMGRTADEAFSASVAVMITAIDQMIHTHEDLMTVMSELENDVFPKIKMIVAKHFNGEPSPNKNRMH